MSSGERSFSHPSPRQHIMGASFAPTTTATWKEDAPATIRFPLWMAVPEPETNHPSEQHHAHDAGQLMQACAQDPTVELGSASR
jgi:hypothetical protein